MNLYTLGEYLMVGNNLWHNAYYVTLIQTLILILVVNALRYTDLFVVKDHELIQFYSLIYTSVSSV